MAKNKSNKAVNELRAFLKKFPDTEIMELLVADIQGVLRGKRIRRNEFESIFQNGFSLPGGTVMLDTLGDAVDGVPFSAGDGDPYPIAKEHGEVTGQP